MSEQLPNEEIEARFEDGPNPEDQIDLEYTPFDGPAEGYEAPAVPSANAADLDGRGKFDYLAQHVFGLCYFTGLPGAGKTIATMTANPPEKIIFVDFDQKSKVRCENLGIPYFFPQGPGLNDPETYDVEALYKWTMEMLIRIKDYPAQGRTVLVLDNISRLEDAFEWAVVQNPRKYGCNPAHVSSGTYGGANPGIGVAWMNMSGYLQNLGFTQIMVTAHMSAVWASGAPTEKYKGKGNRIVAQLANLSVVLIRANRPNTPPVGIVTKEALGLLAWNDEIGDYAVTNSLPPRVPAFNWTNVAKYIRRFETGQITEFQPSEIPSAQELERFGSWFSKEQLALIKAIASNPNFAMSEEETGGAPAPAATPASAPAPTPAPAPAPAQRAPAQPVKTEVPADWGTFFSRAAAEYGLKREEVTKVLKEKFGTSEPGKLALYWEHITKTYTHKQ